MSPAYLNLLTFFLVVLIPVYASSSLAFCMMCSVWVKKAEWHLHILFSQFWTKSVVPCKILTVASWPAYRFRSRQVNYLVFPSLKEFSTVSCDPHSQRLNIVNEAEVDVFLEFPCFFYDPIHVGNLISGSSLSLSQLIYLKFSVHILLKTSLKDFEYYLAQIWNEYNCVVVQTFFGIAFLWDWNENLPFPVLWSLLNFPNWLTCGVQHFHSIIF